MDKRAKIVTYIVIFIILIVLIGIAILTKVSNEAPNVMAMAESGLTAHCIRNGYNWNSFGKNIVVDSISVGELTYQNENTLLVEPGEKITFRNSGRDYDAYEFYREDIRYYDKENKEVIVTEEVPALKDAKYMTVTAPVTEGTYVYSITLNYGKKGTAQYGIKIVVSNAPSYQIKNMMKYKDTYLGNAPKVNQILEDLPYHEYKDGIVLRTVKEPYELIVYYKGIDIEKETFLNNTVALFTLIPNVDMITYQLDEKTVVYTREEVESIFGRDLVEYANDTELWEKEVFYKEEIAERNIVKEYRILLKECISQLNAEYITIDFASFEKNEGFALTNAEKREVLKLCGSKKKTLIESSLEQVKSQEDFKGVLLYANKIEKINESTKIEIVKYYSEKRQEKVTYEILADGTITQK